MERSQGMASGNTGFQLGKSIKFVVNCSLLTFLLCSGGTEPHFRVLFSAITRRDRSRSRAARDERLGVPWAAEDQFKKRIKLVECSLWTLRRN
jgi:hypothetical protein